MNIDAARDMVTRAQQFQAAADEILRPHTLAQEALEAVRESLEASADPRPLLIGLGGHKEAGKDRLADHLTVVYGFEKLGMSDPLAQALYTENPWIPTGAVETQEDGTVVGRFIRYRDIIDYEGYTVAKKNLEVRRLLQVLGTEVGRDQLDPDLWTRVAARKIEELRGGGYPVALTGIRFSNERDMIRAAGGILVWVNRPEANLLQFGQPVTSSIKIVADDQNISQQPVRAIENALDAERAQFHASEVTLTAEDFDITIDNDGSLLDLEDKADGLIESLKRSRTGVTADLP